MTDLTPLPNMLSAVTMWLVSLRGLHWQIIITMSLSQPLSLHPHTRLHTFILKLLTMSPGYLSLCDSLLQLFINTLMLPYTFDSNVVLADKGRFLIDPSVVNDWKISSFLKQGLYFKTLTSQLLPVWLHIKQLLVFTHVSPLSMVGFSLSQQKMQRAKLVNILTV